MTMRVLGSLSLFLAVGCGGTVNVISAGSSDAVPDAAPAPHTLAADAATPAANDAGTADANAGWSGLSKVTRDDALAGDSLGAIIAATDRTIFATSKARDATGNPINAIYVFERLGDYAFYRTGRIDLAADDGVTAMAVSGDTLLVGIATSVSYYPGVSVRRVDAYGPLGNQWVPRGSLSGTAGACNIAFDGTYAVIASGAAIGSYRVLAATSGAPSTWSEEQAGSVPVSNQPTCPSIATTGGRVLVAGVSSVTVLDKGAQGWTQGSFGAATGAEGLNGPLVALAGHDNIVVLSATTPATDVSIYTRNADATFSSVAIAGPVSSYCGEYPQQCQVIADETRIAVTGPWFTNQVGTAIFRPTSGVWQLAQTFPDIGASLALVGPVLAIGEPSNGTAAESAGAVQVLFDRDLGGGDMSFQQDIGAPVTASDAADGNATSATGASGFIDDAGTHWANRRSFGVATAAIDATRVAVADAQSVRFFANQSGRWQATGELLPIPEQYQYQSARMAASSNVLAMAEGWADDNSDILMFTRGTDGSWSGPLSLPVDVPYGHTKGAFLALDGTTLAELAPWEYAAAPPSTSITFHDLGANGVWTQTASFDFAESDDGPRYAQIFAMNAGHAFASRLSAQTINVYDRAASGWQANGTLNAAILPITDPWACAIGGDSAACVGHDALENPWLVVLAHGTAGWTRASKQALPELDSDLSVNAYWTSLAMDGDLVAFGTGRHAVLYQKSDGAVWKQLRVFVPTDVGTSDISFGSALSLTDGLLVVGAPDEGTGGRTTAGAAYIFSR